MPVLDEEGVLRSQSSSLVTTEPASVIATHAVAELISDTSDASWEEMDTAITDESHMTINKLLLMALAGILAVTGIAYNTLHLVIAGIVIAPGI